MYGNDYSNKGRVQIGVLREETPGFIDFVEGLFYESKPLLYVGLAFWALHSHALTSGWFKLGFMVIVLYSVLVVYSRLTYRGYIGKD